MTADLVRQLHDQLETVLGPIRFDDARRLFYAGSAFHSRKVPVEPDVVRDLVFSDAIRLAKAAATDDPAADARHVIAALLRLYGTVAGDRSEPDRSRSRSWRAYLRGAAEWAAHERRRVARQVEDAPLDDEGVEVAGRAASVEDDVVEGEWYRELEEAVVRFLGTVGAGKALAEPQRRRVLELLAAGASHEEIASELWLATPQIDYMVRRLRPFVEEWRRDRGREE